MKNIKNYLLFLSTLFLFTATSCYKYEAQFEGEYDDAGNNGGNTEFPKEVVFIAGGELYMANAFVEDIVLIPTNGNLKLASINKEHSRVLFQELNGNIQIFDVASEQVVEEIADTEDVVWFDYHHNNETVYLLRASGLLDTYGPEVLVERPINLKTLALSAGIGGNTIYARGVVVLEDGSFIYSLETFSTFSSNNYLIHSDGIDILNDRTTLFAHEQFRINQAEDRLWATNSTQSLLSYYNALSLSSIDESSQYELGVPTTGTSGYRISEDNEIVSPLFNYIPSPGGNLTAIDY